MRGKWGDGEEGVKGKGEVVVGRGVNKDNSPPSSLSVNEFRVRLEECS